MVFTYLGCGQSQVPCLLIHDPTPMHVWSALIRPYKLTKKNYNVCRGNCEGYMKEYGVRNQGKDILFCYMFI